MGGRGRVWECRIYEFVEKGGRFLGGFHTVVEKVGIILGGRGRFWEGRT